MKEKDLLFESQGRILEGMIEDIEKLKSELVSIRENLKDGDSQNALKKINFIIDRSLANFE